MLDSKFDKRLKDESKFAKRGIRVYLFIGLTDRKGFFIKLKMLQKKYECQVAE